MARFDLSDEEWALIEPLLAKGGRGRKRKDDRKVLNGVFYILRTGAPWRDIADEGALAVIPSNQTRAIPSRTTPAFTPGATSSSGSSAK